MRCKQGSIHLQIHDGTAVAKTYVNKTAKTIGTDHQCFERNYLTKLKEGQLSLYCTITGKLVLLCPKQ